MEGLESHREGREVVDSQGVLIIILVGTWAPRGDVGVVRDTVTQLIVRATSELLLLTPTVLGFHVALDPVHGSWRTVITVILSASVKFHLLAMMLGFLEVVAKVASVAIAVRLLWDGLKGRVGILPRSTGSTPGIP